MIIISTQTTHTNRLINEKSPYLLQHAHNPVDWYPWGDEAFDKAKAEDKPVFLSIGYSTCHWCHVMERESFEDEEVANILNAHFVSIKVDREERPDVDNFYMNACVAVGGSGGWPLSSFLMPDRRPFFSGTYFPKEDGRYGTGFVSILNRVAELWRNNRPDLLSISDEIIAHCGRQTEGAEKAEIDDACVDRAFRQLQASFDRKYGGFGGAPKFPSPQNLIFLLRCGTAEHQPSALDMVKTTLDAMRSGGIYDQIGGGFSRYSTDARWLVPHFEKMMVDNALHILTYAQAGALINPTYFNTVREIVDFCTREMLHRDGGFFTALDADSEGEEGKYYVFTPAQVKSVLGKEDGGRLCALYDITPGGNFEGKNIPNLIGKNLSENDRMFLYNANQKLLLCRSNRIPPYKDDKVAASVNGFMVAALAVSGSILQESAYISLAERCAEFVCARLVVGGRLHSYWREEPAEALGSSDDYAYIIWGFIELYAATGQPVWLQRALEFTQKLDRLFWDGQNGGYFLSGSDASGLPLRQKNLHDGAIPSGNSVAALNATRLAAVCADPGLQKRARQILGAMAAQINDYPVGYCGALCAQLQLSARSREIVFVNGEGFEELKGCLPAFHPLTAVAVCGEGYEKAAELAPYLAEYKPVGGKAAAFLCSGGSCRPPVTDPDAFKKLLEENPEYYSISS